MISSVVNTELCQWVLVLLGRGVSSVPQHLGNMLRIHSPSSQMCPAVAPWHSTGSPRLSPALWAPQGTREVNLEGA